MNNLQLLIEVPYNSGIVLHGKDVKEIPQDLKCNKVFTLKKKPTYSIWDSLMKHREWLYVDEKNVTINMRKKLHESLAVKLESGEMALIQGGTFTDSVEFLTAYYVSKDELVNNEPQTTLKLLCMKHPVFKLLKMEFAE